LRCPSDERTRTTRRPHAAHAYRKTLEHEVGRQAVSAIDEPAVMWWMQHWDQVVIDFQFFTR
jgi:hypothetical protein